MRNPLLLLLLLLLPAGANAAEPEEYRAPALFTRLSTAVVTPHVAWAKPLPGRRLRLLVIGPRWSQRETVELMERLDADCTPAMLYSGSALYTESRDWGWQKIRALWKEDALAALHRAADTPCDVILVGGVRAGLLPPEVVARLSQRVAEGAGLVYTSGRPLPDDPLVNDLLAAPPAEDAAALTTGVPLEALPGLGIKDREKDLPKLLALRRPGRGRAAFLSYAAPGFLTPQDADDLHYEYYQSLLIRTILWAAGRQPAIVFDSLPNALAVDAGRQSGVGIAFRLRSAAPFRASLAMELRSPDPLYRVPATPIARPGVQQTAALLQPVFRTRRDVSLSPGGAAVALPLPKLPAGSYFADLRVSAAGHAPAWATVPITVSRETEIAAVKITPETVDLEKGAPAGEATAVFSQALAAPAEVRFTAVDGRDRVLADRTVPAAAGAGQVSLKLPVLNPCSTLVRVRAELRVGGQPASIKSGGFTVTHRPWDDFTYFAWGSSGPHYVDRQRARVLAGLGIDAFRGGSSVDALAAAEVRCIPDVVRFSASVKDRASDPCYSDPDARAALAARIQDAVRAAGPFDPAGYLLGDEFGMLASPQDACWSPSCVAGFRRYLESIYHTIGALNDEWGTRFASFAEVMPVTRAEMRERAKGTGNCAPLIDQWRFNYWTFADTLRFCRQALQEAAPGAAIGGSTPLWNWWWRGYDWASILPNLGIFTPYGPWGDIAHSEAGRCFARPGTILSMHYGSYVGPETNDEAHYRLLPYVVALHGFRNVFWYTTWGDEGGVAPSLDPYPCLAANSQEVRAIKSGLGRLLQGARRLDDGIAVHYSIPSSLYSFLAPNPDAQWGKTPFRLNDFLLSLEELGFQYRLVTPEQIAGGALDQSRVLILPLSNAIGAAEAEKMRAFVERGGILIADMRPGIADEHGKTGAENGIAGLLGIRWNNPLQPLKKVDLALSGTYRGVALAAPAAEIQVDPALTLAGASAVLTADGAPLLTHHEVGKGAAICLNLAPSEGTTRDLLNLVLAGHGVRPAARLAHFAEGFQPGAWVPGFECSRFTDGGALYAGITRRRDTGEPAPCTLDFGRAGHLYDMRTGRYLGVRSSLALQVAPDDVDLYAQLPYQVTGIRARAGKATYAPGETVSLQAGVQVAGGTPGRHVLHLDVIRPDGAEVRFLSQNQETTGGAPAAFQVPLALNDPAGAWSFAVTDAATRLRQSVRVMVSRER